MRIEWHMVLVFAWAVVGSSDHRSHVRVNVESESRVQYGPYQNPVYHESAYTQSAYGYYQPQHHEAYPYHAPGPSYHPTKSYHTPGPSYHPSPKSHHTPGYHKPVIPSCAANSSKPWCLVDYEYPSYEIKHALKYNEQLVLSLYADVGDLNTKLSVARPKVLGDETYLCPSATAYVKPLRAVNTEGKWRVIINNINLHYQKLTQTARIEECLSSGDACPYVPKCYGSKCLQKSIYHRFLVYDPYDQYFPFAIETFKLPASCACLLGVYTIDH